MFEVGKVYKNKKGQDIQILYISKGSELVGVDLENEEILHYTNHGVCYLSGTHRTLILPLKKVIGGIYRDNHGVLRVLCEGKELGSLKAWPVYRCDNSYNLLCESDWTKHYEEEFELVKLVHDPGELK